jgi:hypothetical protein
MNESPSTNGTNGDRGEGGRFAKGNRGGPGNPYAAKVARIRAAFLDAVSEEDIRAIVGKLVDEAKAGNLAAAREIFQRTIGTPDPLDMADSHFLARHAHALESE